MDALDLADYEPLLPRRRKKRIGTTILLFALLFPSQFRDMFIAQVERHAQHLTTELLKVMLPEGKKVSSSFLYNGTRRMYQATGFTYERPKGQKNCVMTRTIAPA